ncbi:MAG: hypothetical protein ACOCSL_00495 [Thermoplasmatota archaeon]
MMDTFAQITIPVLILLALRVDTRKVLLMLPFTFLIDLDVFFAGTHRLLFHNLFVAVLLPLAFLIYINKYYKKYYDYALIAFFFIVSSLILDLGQGVALIYPLSTDYYYIHAEILFKFWGPFPIPDLVLDFGTWAAEQTAVVSQNMGAKETVTRYPSMSNTSFGLFFTLLIAALMYYEKSFLFLNEVKSLLEDIIKEISSKIKEIINKM